ncbi:MAG: 16S rRNA (cytosine(967)-C(5))-methyltransferase RsmB [Desulfurivibrionaceae bacterium]|nr:16S rRNA (cytosine(967)-C(5))-methyltransferase RsmB [Desulfobulbaceae bacterium]MDP2001314.1 16S rRNA (cytosine(967)-C(5))-methyltransferase RsmB [Desulfurivibrionaceae bacterium]MDP2757864.1 16S rRNA (cytosine(967)-C(5))-methyltransferase RsmB [Desulfurivibrionaceae bacterium]
MLNSRAIAMDTLLAWEKAQEPLDQVLESMVSLAAMDDPRDRQLVMALVYGVVRWQGYLDASIQKFSSHPLRQMKPLTLAALRVGLYQLIFLDRIPESAAINETVQALKSARQPKWLSGFVNGVLRAMARQRASLPAPDEAAAVLSHPAWLVARWEALFGRERARRICWTNTTLPPLVVRVNTLRISTDDWLSLLRENGIACERGLFAQDGVRIDNFQGSVTALPGYVEGFFVVQDEAAQLVTQLLGPFVSGRYLDGCAGLGGKALHLAQMLPDGGRVVAVEPSRKRQALLKENVERLGGPEVAIHGVTLQEFAGQPQGGFAGVLVDAPCSGLGVIRRQPDIRWQRSLAALQGYQNRQRELLSAAAGLVAKGGLLVYATCSIDPMENDEVIGAFLHEYPEFSTTPAQEYLPDPARGLCDGKGFLKTTPEQGVDGFFAARLQKNN